MPNGVLKGQATGERRPARTGVQLTQLPAAARYRPCSAWPSVSLAEPPTARAALAIWVRSASAPRQSKNRASARRSPAG